MKTIKHLFIVCLIINFISVACDKIEPPFKQNINNNNDTNTYVQKVLIEDFTGHRCGNCPRAHEKLHQLKETYGSKIIGLAIHSGFFATPLPPTYSANYQTTEGDEITQAFGVQNYPTGMVNRKPYNGNILLSHDSWGEAVNEIINRQPSLGIKIISTYNTTNNTVTASITVKILQSVDFTSKLCVFLSEDSIISPQTDYDHSPTTIPNYVHMHMLRKSFNGTWGTEIPLSNKQIGDTIQRNFSLSWDNNWKKHHSHIIAFVYNSTTNEIIQVEEASIP